MNRYSSLCAAGLAMTASVVWTPAKASAQRVAAVEPAQAKVTLVEPVTVIKKSDMDFGHLSVTGAGTAVLNPNLNALTTTGGVQGVGGSPTAAVFTGASRGWTLINIRVPNQPITLTRAGGSETLTISNWTLEGASWRLVTPRTSFNFRVGGTLNVAANQADGFYSGTFNVTIEYF